MGDEQVVATAEAPAAEPAAPAVETSPATEAPATVETTTAQQADAIYDTAAQEFLGDGETAETEVAADPAAPAVAPKTQASTGPVVTESETQLLTRAGYDPADYAGWDRTKIEAKVGKLRETFTQQDQTTRELDTLKKLLTEQLKPQEKAVETGKPQPASQAKVTPRSQRIAKLMEELPKSYDQDILPLIEVIKELSEAADAAPVQANQDFVPQMAQVFSEMVLDMAVDSIKSEYPSLSQPEARQRVEERFWIEWNSGAYQKPGVPLRTQLRSALTNAAKVTFLNTTEQSAAASLIAQNKARVASQPRTGTPNKRPEPATKDDVYDEAYQEILAKG